MLMLRLLSRRLGRISLGYRSVSSAYGIIKSDLPDVPISNETISDLIFNHFSKWDDALIAVVRLKFPYNYSFIRLFLNATALLVIALIVKLACKMIALPPTMIDNLFMFYRNVQ